jgi:3-deoxy-D-manno-octulosonic-acid transferase
MRLLYTLLWYLLMPFLFVHLWWLGARAPAYRGRWRERLALGYSQRLDGCVWVHAVSVGETLAAAPMIEALLQRYPQTPLLVTTTTPTGSERVSALFGDRVHHVYWPWDTPGVISRFWRNFNPQLVILLETELWPNLIAAAGKREVPVVLVNGRLSARSHRRYARLRGLLQPMLESLQALAVQTAVEAERFVDLGAAASRVTVTGNVKFDISLDDNLRGRARQLREQFGERPVWIAASTHPGEDEVVLAAHARLRRHCPGALLILVPRHQERFEQVAELVARQGLGMVRRSLDQTPGADIAVYLADTMGELLMLFGAADIAFVGGSLVPVGGHNLLEPALWSKPIITGPVLHNFTLIADLLDEADAHRVVRNEAELAELLQQLLGETALRQQMGQRAAEVVQAHRGALVKLLAILERHWPSSH